MLVINKNGEMSMKRSYGVLGVIFTTTGVILAALYLIPLSVNINREQIIPMSLLLLISGVTGLSLAISKPDQALTRISIKTNNIIFYSIFTTLLLLNFALYAIYRPDFAIYFIVDYVVYIITVLFFRSLKYGLSSLEVFASVLFLGFIAVVIFKIMEILS